MSTILVAYCNTVIFIYNTFASHQDYQPVQVGGSPGVVPDQGQTTTTTPDKGTPSGSSDGNSLAPDTTTQSPDNTPTTRSAVPDQSVSGVQPEQGGGSAVLVPDKETSGSGSTDGSSDSGRSTSDDSSTPSDNNPPSDSSSTADRHSGGDSSNSGREKNSDRDSNSGGDSKDSSGSGDDGN
jgi:eukaryotic-like serine/threonine-protein kinase